MYYACKEIHVHDLKPGTLGTLVSQNDLLKNMTKNDGSNSVNHTSDIHVTPPDPLIGDSILRDFHSTDQKKLRIRSCSGAKLSDIKANWISLLVTKRSAARYLLLLLLQHPHGLIPAV